jgi:hypothetical protein
VKLSPSFALFGLGACSFLLIFFPPAPTKPFALAGGIAWAAAYFWEVAANFKRKSPVHTRGGLLKYEDNPRGYLFTYSIYVIFGTGLLVTFLGILL